MIWRTERFNQAGVIVSNIENITIFVFWKLHSKSNWVKNLRGHSLNGHDASGLQCLLALLAAVYRLNIIINSNISTQMAFEKMIAVQFVCKHGRDDSLK